MRIFSAFLLAAVLCTLALPPVPALAAKAEGIAVVVNEDAVTLSELNDRLRLIMVSSGMPDNGDIRERLKPQILNVLIEEQLHLQEAKKAGIEISKQDIDEGFASIAQQNKMTPDQFQSLLQSKGIPAATIRRQIESQIAWNRFVQNKLQPQIQITDSDVDTRMEQIRANIGKTEYNVSDIFLPVDSPGQENEVRQLADRLIREIRDNHAPFPAVARQFSQAAGAQQGGNLGWVQSGQLPEELDAQLPNLAEGTISNPIRTVTGFHILQLNKARVTAEDTLPSREQVLNQVGLERLERLQRRYMLDLKAESFIENRV